MVKVNETKIFEIESNIRLLPSLKTLENIELINKALVKSLAPLERIKNFSSINEKQFKMISEIYFNKFKYLENLNLNNFLYKSVTEALIKNNEIFNNTMNYYFLKNPIIDSFIGLINNIAFKTPQMELIKAFTLINFYDNFNLKILQFQEAIVNSFKNIGIIEQRSLERDDLKENVNIYEKLPQSLNNAYKPNINIDVEQLYENTTLSDIYEKGKRIALEVTEINDKSILIKENVFLPSNNLLKICLNLPALICDNEDRFKTLIDCIYKMIWENRTRIMEYKILKNDIDFIEDLRKYYYHDLEHGDPKNKFKKVGTFFKGNIGKIYPENSKDFQNAQICILDKILNILSVIKENVK